MMADFDVYKQVKQWTEGALSSWDDAQFLIKSGRNVFGLFALHLAMEKLIKAHVIKTTEELPPRIHNLLTLASLASLSLTPEQELLLVELNTFNVRGRYSDTPMEQPTKDQTMFIFKQAKEVFKWLTELL
jgi:HEPN domain-containing protein